MNAMTMTMEENPMTGDYICSVAGSAYVVSSKKEAEKFVKDFTTDVKAGKYYLDNEGHLQMTESFREEIERRNTEREAKKRVTFEIPDFPTPEITTHDVTLRQVEHWTIEYMEKRKAEAIARAKNIIEDMKIYQHFARNNQPLFVVTNRRDYITSIQGYDKGLKCSHFQKSFWQSQDIPYLFDFDHAVKYAGELNASITEKAGKFGYCPAVVFLGIRIDYHEKLILQLESFADVFRNSKKEL